MDVLIVILATFIFVAIIGKWVICILLLPSQMANAMYKKACPTTRCSYLKLLALPHIVVNKLSRGGYDLWMSYKVGLVSSHHFRLWYYRLIGADIGKHVRIHIGSQIRSAHRLKIGRGSIIGDHAILDARSNLEIGQDVNISSNVSIWTLQHNHRSPDFACPTPEERRLDVKIENRVWLGCNVIVLPGVTIGEGAVCCGGCVVAKDVSPFTVVAGIPARKVGERPTNLTYHFSGKSCHLY